MDRKGGERSEWRLGKEGLVGDEEKGVVIGSAGSEDMSGMWKRKRRKKDGHGMVAKKNRSNGARTLGRRTRAGEGGRAERERESGIYHRRLSLSMVSDCGVVVSMSFIGERRMSRGDRTVEGLRQIWARVRRRSEMEEISIGIFAVAGLIPPDRPNPTRPSLPKHTHLSSFPLPSPNPSSLSLLHLPPTPAIVPAPQRRERTPRTQQSAIVEADSDQ